MLKANILANYIGQAWVAVLGLACIPIYIHLLGIEAYGVISFIISLQIVLTILDLGITISLNREFAILRESNKKKLTLGHLLRTVELLFTLIAVIIFIGFYMLSKMGANFIDSKAYSTDQLELFMVVAGLMIALRLIEGMYKSCLVGLQEQISVNILNVISSNIRHLGAIFLLMTVSNTIETYLFWQVITSSITLFLFARKLYLLLPSSHFEKRFSPSTLRPIWKFSLGVMGMSILSLCLTNIDKLLLIKLVPLREYAEYMIAVTFAAGLFTVIGPVVQAVYPRLCQLLTSGDLVLYQLTFHKATQLISIIASSISAVIYFNTYDILYLWSQDEELALIVTPLLQFIITGTLLNCLTWMPFQCALSYGNSKLIFKINLFAVVLIVPMFFILVQSMGSYGAALTWLNFNILYFVIGAYLAISRCIPSELRKWLLVDTAFPVLASFSCAAMNLYFTPFETNIWWQKILYITVSFLIVLITSTLAASNIRYLVYNRIFKRAFNRNTKAQF